MSSEALAKEDSPLRRSFPRARFRKICLRRLREGRLVHGDMPGPANPSPATDRTRLSAADALLRARRVVVKIGSALLIDGATGTADRWRLSGIAVEINRLRDTGRQVVVVSSGAVALGRRRLGLTARAKRLDEKQAAAAAGQSLLMHAWEEALEPLGIAPAQILLTRDDTESRHRWLNARATMEALLGIGALPIVNENDTVATEEIRYGDNDRLAARTAQLVQADLLILLSDVDGLYTADPRRDPLAVHIPHVAELTPEIRAMAGGANASAASVGTGGMATKLMAADIARSAGCASIIALGLGARPLEAIEAGARATLISADATPAAAYKQWIAGTLAPKGVLVIDPGALAALAAGKSLLPSGVISGEGQFRKGDCVVVRDEAGRDLALGLINYASDEVGRIRGRKSGEIEGVLGYKGRAELIHRDDLVRIDRA
jgi:glutamate 5-kinase